MSTSVNLFPNVIYTNQFAPDSFGPEVDKVCTEIQAATKGFGTNEKRLLKAMGGCNGEMRCKVPARYFQMYHKDLLSLMKSECGSRHFGTALQYLAVDPVHAECLMIEDACKGFGTNEIFLFSIICGRSNKDIELLKKKYHQLYNRSLEMRIAIEVTGNLDTLAKAVLKGSEEEFNPSVHTPERMAQDAEKLRSMGEGRIGTNESGIFKLLCSSPPRYLQGVNAKYEEKYGHDLVKALQREMSGQLETATLMLLRMKLDPYEAVAKMIHDACKGIGTNELLLTSYLIRYQKIMNEVNTVHNRLYKKSIQNLVKFETSGDYEKVLLEIVEAA